MNDIATGVPVAVMDCTWITEMRTPAVTALSSAALKPSTEYFGMYGAGVQGRAHLRYIPHTLKNHKKIYVYDIHEDVADRTIAEVQPEIDVEIVKAKSPQEIAEKCETMSSATIILRDPLCVVKDEWISEGQTIIGVSVNDIAVGQSIMMKAFEKGVGTILPL